MSNKKALEKLIHNFSTLNDLTGNVSPIFVCKDYDMSREYWEDEDFACLRVLRLSPDIDLYNEEAILKYFHQNQSKCREHENFIIVIDPQLRDDCDREFSLGDLPNHPDNSEEPTLDKTNSWKLKKFIKYIKEFDSLYLTLNKNNEIILTDEKPL